MRKRTICNVVFIIVLLTVLLAAPRAKAALSFSVDEVTVGLGQTVTVDILSDNDMPWIGWVGQFPGCFTHSVTPTSNAGPDAVVEPDGQGFHGYYYLEAQDDTQPYEILAGVQFTISITNNGACDDIYSITLDEGSTMVDTLTVNVAEAYVEVISPNGGETLTAGSTYPIEFINNCGYLSCFARLEYSIDNGSTWILIPGNEISESPYYWQVPVVDSDQCLIRISDSGVEDISDGTFTIYDPAKITIPGKGGFLTIQAAIDAAVDGDTVIVADGVYTGDGNRDIDFLGKNITVRSANGPTNCIVDCQGGPGDEHYGFLIYGGSAGCLLEGFTITGGYWTSNYKGGGVTQNEVSEIKNCIFTNNTAYEGAAIYCFGTGKVTNCTIYNNSSSDYEGVVSCSMGDLKLSNCISWGNSEPDLYGAYDKSDQASLTVEFSILQADLYHGCIMQDCMTINPLFADAANGDFHLISDIGRWDNSLQSWVTDAMTSPAVDAGDPSSNFSDEPSPNGSRINMGAYGNTVEASKSGSIVAGSIFELSAFTFDFVAYDEYVPNPPDQTLSIRNIGSGILEWQITESSPWLTVTPLTGSSTGEWDYVTLQIDTSGLMAGNYACDITLTAPTANNGNQIVTVNLSIADGLLEVPDEYPTIQAAIDAAVSGATVLVADGVYTGDGNRDIDFLGKNITVRSANGPTNCIVDCQGSISDEHFGFRVICELPSCILEGFTVTGAVVTRYHEGGGVQLVHAGEVKNCILTQNYSTHGGAAVSSAGRCNGVSMKVTNCTMFDNFSENAGSAASIIGGSGTRLDLANCISWGNSTPELMATADGKCGHPILAADFSVLQVEWSYGSNCITVDPNFANAAYGDLHLMSEFGRWDEPSQTWVTDAVTSPAIDAGDSTSGHSEELWPHGNRINMGAYGNTAEASMSSSTVGSKYDLDHNGSVGASDAVDFSEDWLTGDLPVDGDIDRDGDVDLNDFMLLAENYML
jgi:hypothetical protein